MTRFIRVVLLLTVLGAQALSQGTTIREVQQVPLDSLLKADTLQNTIPSRWTLQTSPLSGQEVIITGIVVVPAKVLTFTQGGYTMVLYDTAGGAEFGAIFVRSSDDTSAAIQDGFLNPIAGDVVTMTGIVNEFPTNSMNSVTQFEPTLGQPITIVNSGVAIPPPVKLTAGDFYRGLFPAGKVRYSTGEPFESRYVELTNLTVDNRVNNARGTFSMVDALGNQITMYDASRYYTLGHGGDIAIPGDPTWLLLYPAVGTKVDTIRGIITTVSGQENPRGYRIAPVYRSDLVLGKVAPLLSTHRRNPVIVPPDSNARVSIRVAVQPGGSAIDRVRLYYSLNNDPTYTEIAMTFSAADTGYVAEIPKQAAGTFVRYFIKATDVAAAEAVLASSSTDFASDTSKGTFFYTVLNRPVTIRDIQETPFANGRSAYLGASVTIGGIVTADTASIGISPLNTGGTNAWYIQSGNDLWSGLWVVPSTDTTIKAVRNGDSIQVTGTVQENFEVTRIGNITTPVTIVSTGRPEPAPVQSTTGRFGPVIGNGDPNAEPYEGMLITLNNVRVSSLNPTFADPTEFEVDDGSGPMLVRRDGRHRYSNFVQDTITGKTILKLDDRISTLTGVVYFSFRRYKIVPRTDADWGTIVSDVPSIERDAAIPSAYGLEQNYPNPFNPTTQLRYSVPVSGFVTLKVYNLLGQEVETLVSEPQAAGTYTVRFDARSLATGMYVYRLTAGSFTEARKMMLVK